MIHTYPCKCADPSKLNEKIMFFGGFKSYYLKQTSLLKRLFSVFGLLIWILLVDAVVRLLTRPTTPHTIGEELHNRDTDIQPPPNHHQTQKIYHHPALKKDVISAERKEEKVNPLPPPP